MGHEVVVVTTYKLEKDGNLDYFPKGIDSLNVIEIPYFPYYKAKKREAIRLGDKNHRFKTDGSMNRFLNKLSKLRAAHLPLPLHKIFWIFPALRRIKDLQSQLTFDVIISLFSPFSAHIIAYFVRKNYPVFWIADYRDLLIGNHFDTPKWPFSKIIKSIEKFFLKKSDLVTTVSVPLQAELKKYLKKPVAVVENGFDKEIETTEFKNSSKKNNGKNLVYTGTLYPQKQDPTPLFRALKQFMNNDPQNKTDLNILFFINEIRMNYLEDLAIKYGVKKLVAISSFVPRPLSLRLQKDAEALIFFDWNDSSEKGVTTGKIYEYIASGTPIISIGGNRNSIPNRIIQKTQTGICLGNDHKEIEKILYNIAKGDGISISPNKKEIDRYHSRNIAKRFEREIYKRRTATNLI